MWYSKLSHKLIGLQDKKIVDPILSDVFLKKMHKTLKGLRPTHLLLRLFYSDDCCIIEVVPKPNELEAILRSFPVSKPSSEKPHPLFPYHQNQQLLKVFHARRGFTGTLNTNIQGKIVEDIHYVAYMLDPLTFPSTWGTPFMMGRLRHHAVKYRQNFHRKRSKDTLTEKDKSFLWSSW